MLDGWEAYVRARFPGYLLPASAATRLSVEEARRFLEGITGRPDQLQLLRASSMLGLRVEALAVFCEALVDLVRNLPSRTERVIRQQEGGFRGRLAAAQTRKLHDSGRTSTFASTMTTRDFDLPENIVVRAVHDRLKRVLGHLQRAVKPLGKGWTSGLEQCENILHRSLVSKPLEQISLTEPTLADENAARMARHRAYHHAARWAGWLREALDDDDPSRIARVVAEGALLPLEAHTRFELAVAIRLAEAVERELSSRATGRWRTERALVLPDRKEVIAFVRDDGVAIRLFYNQAVFPISAAERRRLHYLGGIGRMRPDVTLTIHYGERLVSAVVVECKLSFDSKYILSGYHEATVYRTEYAESLLQWPKAVLVVPGAIHGLVCPGDDVIASSWADWPSPTIIEAIVEQTQI